MCFVFLLFLTVVAIVIFKIIILRFSYYFFLPAIAEDFHFLVLAFVLVD